MQIQSFNSIESTFLTKFNEGFRTFEDLKQNVPFNETTLNNVIETMIANSIIKFDSNKQEYVYDSPVNGDKIVLDGNIMLPTTIIRKTDKLIVSRGLWYEFEPDFDIRRIIWNVQLPNNSRSTLVDLIKESVLKVRKSKIEQLPEYKKLINIIIPWKKNIKLKINTVGAENTDVTLIFVDTLLLDKDSDDVLEFRDFTTKTEILTSELIDQLTKSIEDREFEKITLNRIFNFSDFIFAGNCIPYSNDSKSIEYAKITAIRGRFELTYYSLDNSGNTTKLNNENFSDVSAGLSKLRDLFKNYTEKLLVDNDFLLESDD